MSDTKHTKVLIIGSGPAGYTAAIYAARANLKPVQFLGIQPGGQLTITTEVENYPGFAEIIQGPWLMDQMKDQAENVGTEMIYEMIKEVDLSKRPFTATSDSGDIITADSVIIATGAKARWLGLPSESEFMNKGVSACATCDGFFYRDQDVIVVGGGNSAVEEALFLTNFCKKVTLVHRRDELRAERMMQDRLFKNKKVEIIWDSVVKEVLGDDSGVTGARIENVKTGDTSELQAQGFFVAIGHDPATSLFKGQVDMDDENYILAAPNSTETSVPGVFAAGDVADKIYRQAVTAAGMGCMAALEADKFLAENGIEITDEQTQGEAAE